MKLRGEDQVGEENWRAIGLEVTQTEPPGNSCREETLGQGPEERPETRRTRGLWHLRRPCHCGKQGLSPAQCLGAKGAQ